MIKCKQKTKEKKNSVIWGQIDHFLFNFLHGGFSAYFVIAAFLPAALKRNEKFQYSNI